MCAEAVPWRCHRSLIADALVARGWEVRHILSQVKADEHRLRPFAVIDGNTLSILYQPIPLILPGFSDVMWYSWLADLILCIHVSFVLFVIVGGLLVLRWQWIAWLHLPAAAWGAIVEFTGWICPLTPLEDWFRAQGGGNSYRSDFIAQYLLPVLYPGDLTRGLQLLLGTVVVVLNAAIYWWLWQRQSYGVSRNR